MRNIQLCILLLSFFLTYPSFAQESDIDSEQKDVDLVEKLLEKKTSEFQVAPTRVLDPAQKKQKAEYSTVQSEAFYSDLAIVQKNYMPKTERVQIHGGFTLLPTDVFFRTIGLNLKASYHLMKLGG